MISMLLVFLHIVHALHLPETASDVVFRLIGIAIVNCRHESRVADHK